MSKQGVNTTPTKQDNNSFKKDNRNQNSGLNINAKEERRSGGFNSTPSNQQGRGGGQNQNNSNQNNQQHDRDRSSNRNENKQFDNKAVTETEKTADKDDKNVEGSTGGTGPAPGEKKFTGRCRLFVGNLTPDVTESDFRKMFEPFGEIAEVYVNTSRGFGFIRLDYRQNAEAAKAALDGHQRKGRILRVRFATHGAALKVKNLHPYVSNELLEQSFSQFGELERCVVIVDDRGKPTGEGIVEFVRKPGANSALRRINEGVFLMGIDPKPVAVEPLEQKDEEDGMPEKFLTKTDQYKKEREKEPRFAPPGTFEYEFGMRWKALEDLEKQRIEQIKKDTEEARLKLEDEMQNALYEYQAEQIRQDLLRQQEELRRLEELRKQDRMRRQQEMELRRQQDDRERAQQEERRRTDMMLSMRQQELARGRGPLDSRGRDDILMADRYGDRMSDRMPDRMGDRMSDRIGDRMGPGQSGFMWDDNQRGEAGMRGDGGRGRDMRGSGAPPLQPPPVPPSGPGALERGGQSMAASAQSSKSSPKPLMGTSGFGNIGNQPGNAPGANNPSASSDNSNMAEEDVNEESICSVNDAESQNIVTTTENDLDNSRLDIPPVSLKVEGEDVHHTIEKCQLPTNNFSPDLNEEEHPGLWSAPTHYNDGSMDESENIPSSRPPVVLPLDKDRKDNTTENPTKKPRCDYDFNTTPSEQTPCDLSTSKSLCFSTPRNNTFFVGNSSSELLTKLNSQSKENCMDEPEMDIDETYLDGTHSKDKIDPGGRVKPPLQRYLSADDVSDEQTVPKEFKIQRYLSADNMDLTGVQSYLSNDIVPVECSSLHSNESYQSIDTLHISESNNYKPSDVPSQYTSSDAQSITDTSNSDHSYKNVQKLCNTSGDYVTSHTDTLDFKLPPSLHVDMDSNNSCSDYNQVLEEYNSTYEAAADSDNYKQTVPSEDSPISDYNQSDVNLISYKQTCSEDVSDMDTEGLDESTAQTTDSPGIYQSYEEGISSHYGSAALNSLIGVPGVAEYNTSATSEENWVSSGSGDSSAAVISNSEVPSNSYLSSSSFTDTQNTLTVASTSSMSATVTSTQNKVSGGSKDDHEGALCTGDQSFKTAAARQSAMGPFLQASRSVPFVPSINPSIYAGTAMVQGIPGPTIMSTSSVHIQHPNGATIMRQQTVSAGLNGGGITQATLMQQQAMANGAQATAVLQQRTMTNRGQTMVLQQRTINTGLGAMTQQTLVQQRLAAPNNVAQAMFQANALRHRAMVSQQATILQQRAIRLAQARAMGTQLMRAQALRGAALLQQAAVGTQPSMLSQGLVRTANPAAVMQQLVRQRYLGGPVMPGRGVQMVAGRPVRVKLTYTRETLPMESNT